MTTPLQRFIDRRAAGRELGRVLAGADGVDTIVLGIPRGGVPVAFEVASALDAPLDVLVVRRLYAPGGAVVGAVGETGAVWVAPGALARAALGDADVSDLIMRESLATARQARSYREQRSRFRLEGRRVVLVDDGLVTGASAIAAVRAVRQLAARQVVLAVPVADPGAAEVLRPQLDALVTLHVPAELGSLARWYGRFPPVTDGEVAALLAQSRARAEAALEASVP